MSHHSGRHSVVRLFVCLVVSSLVLSSILLRASWYHSFMYHCCVETPAGVYPSDIV